MKKNILISISGILFIAMMIINFSFTTNASIGELTLSSIIAQAGAEPEAVCLRNYVYSEGEHEQNGKRCWMDKDGPDVFEGYVVECHIGGAGCQGTWCDVDMQGGGCYTTND